MIMPLFVKTAFHARGFSGHSGEVKLDGPSSKRLLHGSKNILPYDFLAK
jgi:hypothetical protein